MRVCVCVCVRACVCVQMLGAAHGEQARQATSPHLTYALQKGDGAL